MLDITSFIESQFPSVYRQEGKTFVAFVKAYYEWLEQKQDVNLIDAFDIDRTIDEFQDHFKRTYLNDFPFVKASSIDFLIKHVFDYYKSKGSEESVKLLIMMLFGEEATVFSPSQHLLKPSSSKWKEPRYLEVENNEHNGRFVGKQLRGVKTKATAIVEAVVTKVHNGRFIDVIYISNLKGSFQTGEKVTFDGDLSKSPIVLGSMTDIEIEDGGKDFRVGDILNVVSDYGVGGKIRVKTVVNSTGRVEFALEDGGSGYTTTPSTEIYISDGIINLENDDLAFIDMEKVYQQIERLSILSYSSIDSMLTRGRDIRGVDENGNQVAKGILVSQSMEDDEKVAKIFVETGTFLNQRKLTLSGPHSLRVGDVVETPSRVSLAVASITGTISAGNTVEQIKTVASIYKTAFVTASANTTFTAGEQFKQENALGVVIATGIVDQVDGANMNLKDIQFFNGATALLLNRNLTAIDGSKITSLTQITPGGNQTVISRSFGVVESVSGNDVVIYPAYGVFESNFNITYKSGSSQVGASGVDSVVVDTVPSRASVSGFTANTVDVKILLGSMPSAGPLFHVRTKKVLTVTSNTDIGATDIFVEGNPSQRAVIDLVADNSLQGTVIGQNTSAIGIWGNTSPFITASDMTLSDTAISATQLIVLSSDVIRVSFGSAHDFVLNDWVKSVINIQVDQEVRNIEGIYKVVGVTANTINLELGAEDAAIFQGVFSLFPSTFSKTTMIPLRTDRSSMISPPRNSSGDIIEVYKNGIMSSTGAGADFKIGSIENEETVFLETDFLKDHNVVDIPLINVKLNGEGSGIGFLGSVNIVSAGTGYSQGQVITFSGGGLNGGEPETTAEAVISKVGGSGQIQFIRVLNHGEGYFETPTINMPSTSGTAATLTPNMDFGYGFPKLPHGDDTNLLIDLLNREPFVLGSVSSLTSVNPGKGYNADPFVRIVNPYIAGFGRQNFIINMRDKVGSFMPGEMLIEEVGGDVFPKGIVIQDLGPTVIIKRLFFNTSFTINTPLKGVSSLSYGTITNTETVQDSPIMGDNAHISSDVISADGIISEIDVIDSGWGYSNGDRIYLEGAGSRYIVTGTISNETQGKGEGYWDSEESHLNSSARIQDSDYWQEFSYEIVSPVPFEKYRDILSRILHVAGSKMFGRFDKQTKQNIKVESETSVSTRQITNISVFGGDITRFTRDGAPYVQVVFKNSGILEIDGNTKANWALGAGGGSGGRATSRPGGGAAGEVKVFESYNFEPGSYTVLVGAGGPGLLADGVGNSGSPSQVLRNSTSIALCAGGGGGGQNSAGTGTVLTGGSGGSAAGKIGTKYSGGRGLSGETSNLSASGGGAGNGGHGQGAYYDANGLNAIAGHGGKGVAVNFMNPVTRVGGGGGGVSYTEPNMGEGTDGGSNGSRTGDAAANATWSGGAGGVYGSVIGTSNGGDGFAVFVFEEQYVKIRNALSDHYGINQGDIAIHLSSENVSLNGDGKVVAISNAGGGGPYFTATVQGVPLTLNTNKTIAFRSEIASSAKMFSSADIKNVRLMWVMDTSLLQNHMRIFGGGNATSGYFDVHWISQTIDSNTVSGVSIWANVSGTPMSLPINWLNIPTSGLHIFEIELTADRYKLFVDGTNLIDTPTTPVDWASYPVFLLDYIGAGRTGTDNPVSADIGDVMGVILGADAEDTITDVRRYFNAKYTLGLVL